MDRLSDHTNNDQLCLPALSGTEAPWCFAEVLAKLEEAVIIVNTPSHEIIFHNDAARNLLTTLQLETSFEALRSFLASKKIRIEQNESSNQQHSLIHNNRIVNCTIRLLQDNVFCLQLRDVTEEKRLESIAQTVNTMDNLGFIFSGIRHEIGNPLNSIKMTNRVLQKNLERFSLEDISRYIDRSATEISRMEYLLKSLKNFSMYEKTDCQPHDLRDFLGTLVGLIEPDLKRKKIHIEMQLPQDATVANIDPRALHQVMLNLITNAADALSNRPNAKITIRVEIENPLVWLIVKDNGCGMTEEQISMLFQPFYTDKAHGNGLGLVITKKLLTMMQASITINSCINKGSTARIGLSMASTSQDETMNNLNRAATLCQENLHEHNING